MLLLFGWNAIRSGRSQLSRHSVHSQSSIDVASYRAILAYQYFTYTVERFHGFKTAFDVFEDYKMAVQAVISWMSWLPGRANTRDCVRMNGWQWSCRRFVRRDLLMLDHVVARTWPYTAPRRCWGDERVLAPLVFMKGSSSLGAGGRDSFYWSSFANGRQ